MRWICNKRNCRKTVSIFQNTIFANSNYTISQVLELIYLYCENLDIGEKARAMGVDRHSASQFMKRLDNILINYCLVSEEKIGSRRSIVEIDETHFFTRKYNNGRELVGQSYWIIGAIKRRTKFIKLRMG
ncbi:hypothetical protein ENBRE01_2303 [Enteropsectra breve]|nr:hypothetical protein ENBRE01_2303 [Enteropsectra breve]